MIDPLFALPRVALAETAAQLLAEREAKLPSLVASARLDAASAKRKLRTARAIARFWQAVIAVEDVLTDDPAGTFGATWTEMRDDLADAAARTAKRAQADPSDARLADLADALAALHAQFQPWSDQTPRPYIVMLFETDREARFRPRRREPARRAA